MMRAEQAAARLTGALDDESWSPRRSHVESARNDLADAAADFRAAQERVAFLEETIRRNAAAYELQTAKFRDALHTFASRAETPRADEVPDDGTVTFFMKDVRAAQAALKRDKQNSE